MKKIEFKIGREEYVVKDVTLQNYKEVLAMLENQDPETPYEIVEFLSGCPKETLKELKFSDWYFLWDETKDLLLGTSDQTTSIIPVIEFAGKRYGLPSIEDMSVGEFIDLDLITTGPSPENRLAEIAAILYRPIAEETEDYIVLEKYSVEEAKKREKLFRFLPLSVIKSANAFFLQSASQSLVNMLDSSKSPNLQSTLRQDLEELERFHQPELGGLSLTSLLEKIPYDFQKLQPYLLDQPLTGLLGSETKLESKN
jgi:hypothetical protein